MLASRAGAFPVILEEVDPASRAILEAHGFDAEAFERLRRELADGTLRDRGNVVQGIVDLPLDSDLTQLPAPGEPGFTEAAAAGTEALRAAGSRTSSSQAGWRHASAVASRRSRRRSTGAASWR